MESRKITDTRALIDMWATRADFARAIRCNENAVKGMYRRNRIDPKHWDNVIFACDQSGVTTITKDFLHEIWLKAEKEVTSNAA